MFNNIYKNKKVLLTGHTGFKGSWMAYWLSVLGADVYGISLPPNTQPNHFDLLQPKLKSVLHTINDYEFIQKAVDEINPKIVFHLAAQPLVRLSYQIPLETYQTNIIGTANILEAIRKNQNVKAAVVITTDKCYENVEQQQGYKETDRMGGFDPYSSSKGCAELVIAAYRNSYFNENKFGQTHQTLIASARAGNVIGGGDWSEDRLIPDVVKAASENKTTLIRSPKAIRPWQHVLEPLSGYLLLGKNLLEQKKEFASAWNFGPEENEAKTVEDVLTMAKKHWDKINFEIEKNAVHPHEAGLLSLNIEKAKTHLNWLPVWHTANAVEKTIEWYKNYYQSKNIITKTQLEEYCSLINY